MDNDPPIIRCPACGSTLTAPLATAGMWECRYHLCRLIFPVRPIRERGQVSIAAEEVPPCRWNPTDD
jgi:ribosomal protein L37AE/L43A